ncbi:MAG: hypothetical protein LBM73_00620, partial [Candidatus Nomurabacteria bacterium]|nr:hypothetical protein [Candidatus Nomurabacteria bacterium]
HNYEIDARRYLNPPTVTIGGKTCSNVVLVSTTEMHCNIPSFAGDPGAKDIVVGYNGATKTVGSINEWGVTSVDPTTGNPDGGDTITISGGGFPYADVSGYDYTGLVAMYDGLDNLGTGDENHATTSDTWKDLSGNGNDLRYASDSAVGGDGTFAANGWTIPDSTHLWGTPTIPTNLPTGNSPFSVEVRYQWDGTPADNNVKALVTWGISSNSQGNGTGLRSKTQITHWFWGNDRNYTDPSASTGANTMTVTYDGTNESVFSTNHLLGTALPAQPVNVAANTPLILGHQNNSKPFGTGSNGYNGTGIRIINVRVYDHVLSASEREQNFRVDEARYISPPTVTIGGNSCGDLTVNSLDEIKCQTPAGEPGDTEPIMMTAYGETVKIGDFTYGTPVSSCGYLVFGNADQDNFSCDTASGNLLKITGSPISLKDDPATATTIGSNHAISITGDVKLTINGDATAEPLADLQGVSMNGAVNLNILTGRTFSVQGDDANNRTGILIAQSGALNIIGDGTLAVESNTGAAGIGGGGTGQVGKVNISSGTVKVTGDGAVGIGIVSTSSDATFDGVNISGGTVLIYQPNGVGIGAAETVTGAGAVTISGGTVISEGENYGIKSSDITFSGGNIIPYAAGKSVAINGTPKNADGSAVTPVYVPLANINTQKFGDIIVPADGSNGKLSDDYKAPLADVAGTLLGDPYTPPVAAVIWLPGAADAGSYNHYTDIATTGNDQPADELIANVGADWAEWSNALNHNLVEPIYLKLNSNGDSISLSGDPLSGVASQSRQYSVATNESGYRLSASLSQTALKTSDASGVCLNKSVSALTATGSLTANHWAWNYGSTAAPTTWLAPTTSSLTLKSTNAPALSPQSTPLWLGAALDTTQTPCVYHQTITITATASP